ncbi:MAG: hypothetical protein LQ340_001545 [Diploschistes diacapsis]|nr:MAG: hypothetical protein LQ340_001545 [Diploschistes diacapsis]
MSIYGQDTRMLDIIYPPPSYPPSNPVSTPLSECNDPSIPTSKCHFFTLPLELRQQIYSYILPYTSFITSIGTGGIVWYRGNTTILAASRLLHEECAAQLYGSSVFSLCVTWDCTIFDFRWVHPLGLLPKRRMPFPEGFSNRSLKLMRRFFVRINHLDPYTGMIKYNFSGPGLTDGVRDQVSFLVQTLRIIPELAHLQVELKDEAHTPEAAQRVLGPLMELNNVHQVTCSGDASSAAISNLELSVERSHVVGGIAAVALESRVSNTKS